MALTDNHFALFDMAASFDLDLKQLATAYRQLQSQYHPDKFAHSDDRQRRWAEQTAAQINEAYQTLKNPLSRGRYLLALQGQPLDDSHNPRMDSVFLMQQLTLREQLDQLAKHQNDQLTDFNRQLEQSVRALVNDISQNFAHNDLNQAKQNIYKLHFFNRLQQDALTLADQFDD
jgi:molecular chaperone HscB